MEITLRYLTISSMKILKKAVDTIAAGVKLFTPKHPGKNNDKILVIGMDIVQNASLFL